MLVKELVTKENIEIMRELFFINFPEEGLFHYPDGRDCFERSLDPNEKLEYYIVYLEEYKSKDIIGHFGIYEEPSDPKSSWLGWFGVMPEFRRERYGTRIIKMYEELAKKRGYTHARLYTDKKNITGQSFYKFNGYTLEDFNGPYYDNMSKVMIGSKSLCKDIPLELWHDKKLEF